jgi:hypothetical protein
LIGSKKDISQTIIVDITNSYTATIIEIAIFEDIHILPVFDLILKINTRLRGI